MVFSKLNIFLVLVNPVLHVVVILCVYVSAPLSKMYKKIRGILDEQRKVVELLYASSCSICKLYQWTTTLPFEGP